MDTNHGWRLVAASAEGVSEVVPVINAAHHQFGRGDLFTVAQVESIVSMPSVDLERDGRRMVNAEGTAEGFVMTMAREPGTTVRLYVTMPEHQDRSAGLRMLTLGGLEIARSRADVSRDAVIEAESVPEEDHALLAVLTSLGFEQVRRTCEMVRDLRDVLELEKAALGPPGIQLGEVRADDDDQLAILAAVNREAFSDHDGEFVMSTEDFVHVVRTDPTVRPDLSVVALDNGVPVGLALAMTDASDEEGRTGYISIVGVARRARGRGVARGILNETFRRFRGAGWSTARLNVQIDNRTGADRLYRSVGMTPGFVDLTYARPLW